MMISPATLEVRHVEVPGNRRPLVFLHEGLGCVDMWNSRTLDWPLAVCQATGRSGWVYSRRGYGQSDPVEDVRGTPRQHGAWHIGRHEPDYMHIEAHRVLPHLLERLGIERPVLIGHSDGATIALLHASLHPVSACVAIAPHVWVEDEALNAIAAARDLYLTSAPPGTDGKGLRQRLARYHADVDNAFWQWNDVWLSEAFRGFDIRPELGSIRAPLLAIQGENDPYGTMAQIDEIAQAVPHARLLKLPDCGHSPHRDQPEAVAQAIEAFMAQVRA